MATIEPVSENAKSIMRDETLRVADQVILQYKDLLDELAKL